MPFTPLPTSFADHLSRLDPQSDPVVELGCGEGRFGALLTEWGVATVGLDLRGPAGGTRCAIVGDARRPPLRPGSVSVLIAANLVRHLMPRHRLGEWVAGWRSLLKPGGRLYVFEDEPGRDTPARRNFRDLQDFLAQLLPGSRGPLLSARRFGELTAAAVAPADWVWGSERNTDQLDAGQVMRMLSSGAGAGEGPVAGLIRRIGREGIAPERYWWARLDGEETAT